MAKILVTADDGTVIGEVPTYVNRRSRRLGLQGDAFDRHWRDALAHDERQAQIAESREQDLAVALATGLEPVEGLRPPD